jgi:hypothetical protein
MADRRYNDEEIAAIFRAASEGPALPTRDVSREEGLTLTDLQAIGREVGLAPEAVAQAAQSLDIRRGAASRTLFGLPIGVARTVNLNRRLSDDEWDRLVVQLREVFDARGVTRTDGALRTWSNGNLQVLLEPIESGHRLRFRTVNGAARASMGMGAMMLGMSAVTAAATMIAGHATDADSGIAILGLAGLGLIANGALRLPRWARLRGKQMEAIAANVAAASSPASPPRPALPPDGTTALG